MRKITVIKGGNLIDGKGAKPKKNAIIIIEETRILAVGEEGEVEIPKKVKRTEVDASGKTVMPGLIDSHLHLIGMKSDRLLEEKQEVEAEKPVAEEIFEG
jgi:imidazolonepropionase-like amidohydrolase